MNVCYNRFTYIEGMVIFMYDTYILYIFAFLIVMIAQSRVQNAYHKYKQIENVKRITGAQAARMILDQNGLQMITVEVAQGGVLSDHYDPVNHVVRLSSDIYYHDSIASIAVAAHEVGHAIQHKERYGFIALRNRLLPYASIASKLGWITLFVGLLFFQTMPVIFYAGVGLLLVIVAFQLVTLPVELNASARAMKQLEHHHMISAEEHSACASMLRAAAFTYIAALISSILQVLRVILIARRRDD